MKILDFLVQDAINVKLGSGSKKEVLAELVEPLVKAGKVTDGKKMVEVLLEREELGSTGWNRRRSSVAACWNWAAPAAAT